MEIIEAYSHLKKTLTTNTGNFYSSSDDLALGVGKIYTNIRYPIYYEDENIFYTSEGLVFVLTHECDIDSNNVRLFNTDVLINPIIDFTKFVQEQSKVISEDKLRSFITSLSKGEVSRVMYLPYFNQIYLPYGGLMYLNHICSTNVSAFTLPSAQAVCAVTAPGLEIIDKFLHNHLLRPKSDRLAFSK
jgi:hypothetical protein